MSGTIKPLYSLLVIIGTIFSLQSVYADESDNPVISIIIDDIGYRTNDDLRAIGLPGKVAVAIMPHSPNARKMSSLANELGKDVLLHMPMQATENDKNKFLGPGALTLQMTEEEFVETLEISLQAVPHASGVNNHMGSLLTRHPGHMGWLMTVLKKKNKFYLDSVTSNQSVAGDVAREIKLPHLTRDVFLDNEQNEESISAQFMQLINIAKKKGYAVAIGHPYPATVDVLSKKLTLLNRYGVSLVSPRDLLQRNFRKSYIRQAAVNKSRLAD